jgi:uncharacterized integral membrane protein
MIRNTVFILLIAVVLIFVFQNIQVVEVKFLFWKLTMSRALMLLGTLAIGLAGGWLLTLPKQRRRRTLRK